MLMGACRIDHSLLTTLGDREIVAMGKALVLVLAWRDKLAPYAVEFLIQSSSAFAWICYGITEEMLRAMLIC